MYQNSRLQGGLGQLIEAFLFIGLALLPAYRHLAETGIVIALVLWVVKKLLFREPWHIPKFLLVCYGLFLLTIALSIFQIPPEPLTIGFHGTLKWIKYLLLFAMCVDLSVNPVFIKKLALVFFCSMILVAVNGLFQYWTGTDFLTQRPLAPGRIKRIISSFTGANGLSAFLLIALPLAYSLSLEVKKSKWKRGLILAGFILLGVAFVLTFSRSAFCALGITLAGYALVTRKFKLATVTFGALFLLLFLYKPLFHNFIASLFDKGDITVNERWQYWQVTWNMIQAHPLLGNGVHTYFYKFSHFAPPELAHYNGHAHNSYLQMWSEIGLIGVIFFFIPVIRILKTKTNPLLPYFPAIQLGITAFLIQSLFDTNLYALQTATLFWIFWGVLAAGMLNREGDNGRGSRIWRPTWLRHSGSATRPVPKRSH